MAVSSKENSKYMIGYYTPNLRVGDHVRVCGKDEILEVIEIDFGGESFVRMDNGYTLHWNDGMYECCNKTGIVSKIDGIFGGRGSIWLKEDITSDNAVKCWTWCSKLLRKID